MSKGNPERNSRVKIITISREVESWGDEIGNYLASVLSFRVVDSKNFHEHLKKYYPNLPPEPPPGEKERNIWLRKARFCFEKIAQESPLIILGRGGQKIFENHPDSFHILVVASLQTRLQRVVQKYSQEETIALRILLQQDKKRERFLLEKFDVEWKNPALYHFTINTSFYSVEKATELILEAIESFQRETRSQLGSPPRKPSIFAHPSEEEFAKLLDFYGIKWLYEPKTFPLEWDEEGNVVEAFTPDFYLPEFNTFIELTTQRQKLVWRKNKKVRKFRELYPDLKIKIIYSRNLEHIRKKLELEDE
ncbi:cytidylate kinase family protein [Thermatribacter velox]|uniref:Cytidylate kinase family protein n=1 Tax=Thermatribacter velox TaxID=3039681 RepID=A0ABZ2YAF0_9BACT